MREIRIDGIGLTIEAVESVARRQGRAVAAPAALRRMAESRRTVERLARSDAAVYGVNTGFGNFSQVRIKDGDLEQLQLNLLRSHAAGVGPLLSEQEVRAMVLLRANVLLKAGSGARPSVVLKLLELLDLPDAYPAVPSQGSVGASGDLAPLAHLALVLVGEGRLVRNGRPVKAGPYLQANGIEPLRLSFKEGLALINGTQASAAIGALAQGLAERLIRAADLVGAMSLEALRGSRVPLDARLHAIRPHAGQVAAAASLRRILGRSEIMASHKECGRVQDSYTLRCMPQVHGAVRDTAAFSRRALTIEMNSCTDNPTVLMPSGEILSGGNFHGEPIAFAMDFLGIALAELGNISERRSERLVNADLSHLPPFLIEDGGLNSGFMMAQVTQAALASENKVLAHPASVDTIPTSANQEDHVSMSPIAARKAMAIARNCHGILAVELLAAAQALDFLRPLRSSATIEAARRIVRSKIPFLDRDREIHKDIEKAKQVILSDELQRLAGRAPLVS